VKRNSKNVIYLYPILRQPVGIKVFPPIFLALAREFLEFTENERMQSRYGVASALCGAGTVTNNDKDTTGFMRSDALGENT
jgi:hypothetical protein